nr:unnamed protein product [Callosobruchus chinensis]
MASIDLSIPSENSEKCTNGDHTPAKKLKLEDEPSLNDVSIHEKLTDLSSFKVKEILQNNTNRKVTCLRGSFDSHAGEAVVVLEKPAFSEETLKDYFKGNHTLTKSFHNDIYGDYRYNPSAELNDVKATIIHPATEKNIQKFMTQKHYMIEETPKIYTDIILPSLADEESHLQWVYNILEHKSETSKIVVEDTDPNDGFIMVPDMKWGGELDTLYLLAIVNKRDIKSLRDLTGEHLPLLKNIREKGTRNSNMYELIILEIRPRLCSVNGFIKFSKRPDDVKVSLEDGLKLVFDGKVKIIPCQLTGVVKNSLSVKVNDTHVIFRFATKNGGSGSFKTEVLQNSAAVVEFSADKPLFSVNTPYTCLCKKCKAALTNTLIFKRALPLPSENLDPSEWFCHKSDASSFSLDPKLSDIFYTHCSVQLNSEYIQNTDETSKVLLCKSCQNWLGVKYNDKTVKFWLNTVEFTSDNRSITTSGLQDAFDVIKGVFNHKLQSSTKIMLCCQTASNVAEAVLLWVLEKKLEVFFDDTREEKKCEVAKVLYKSVANQDKMFDQWKNDVMVETIDVSKEMVVEVLNHLTLYNEVLPDEFSTSNDLSVSYLFMYNPAL